MLGVTMFWTSVWSCVLIIKSFYGILGLSSSNLLASCLNLKVLFFMLDLLGGISVCWCCRRLTCTACGSLATCFIFFTVVLELSILLASWHNLLVRNLLEPILLSLIVLKTNSLSFRKNQNISLWRIYAVSWGYLVNAIYVCTALYHSSTLLSPCLKLVNKSNLALTSLDWGLQNSSNFSHRTSRINSSLDKFQEMYWSKPKSPLQATTFLNFLASGNITSSHCNIFSHFNCHLRNLLYNPSFTVQSILGPSIKGINIFGITSALDGGGWGWKKTSWSELEDSSGWLVTWTWLLSISSISHWSCFILLVALGILRHWFQHLQVSLNIQLMQAVKWLIKVWLLKLVCFNL